MNYKIAGNDAAKSSIEDVSCISKCFGRHRRRRKRRRGYFQNTDSDDNHLLNIKLSPLSAFSPLSLTHTHRHILMSTLLYKRILYTYRFT